MITRKRCFLMLGCMLAIGISAGGLCMARDKGKESPGRERAASSAPAPKSPAIKNPAVDRTPANRASNDRPAEQPRQRVIEQPRQVEQPRQRVAEQPRQKVETTPRIERRNDSSPPANGKPLQQVNPGGSSGRPSVGQNVIPSVGSTPRNDRDNRGNTDKKNTGGALPRLETQPNQVGRSDGRNERRDPPSTGIPLPGTVKSGAPVGGGASARDDGKGKPGRGDSVKPQVDTVKPGNPSLPKPGAVSGKVGGSSPPLGLPDGGKPLDRRDGNDKGRDGNRQNDVPKILGRPDRAGDADSKKAVGGNTKTVPLGKPTIGGDDIRHRTTPVRIEKNGQPPKLELKPEVQDRVAKLWQTKDHKEFRRHLDELKATPEAKSNPQIANLKLDRVSGAFQDRVVKQEFKHWQETDTGRRLNLDRQFQLHRHGDISRQLNLGTALVQSGGWQHRRHGHVNPTFTRSSFSCWYAGGGFYPRYCWCPRWTTWVDWCWWDTCLPIYDPRPIYCRPVIYDPCPTWVVYEYPVWQSLPVVTCGTWVDVPPVTLDSGVDLQLLATRFVDNGHPDQNLGPRFRIWFRNNGPVSTTTPFNVLLLAANDPVPSADLPQAGAVVNGINSGEMKAVDIRLPLTANRMAVTPEGQHIPFGYLHVLVDSHRELVEADEVNNGSVIARTDILPVDPAAFSSDVSAASPGSVINVAGEGFGPEPGQVLISMNGLQLQAEIHGWYDLGVRVALPQIALTGPTDAEVLVVRGDGAAANPLDIRIAPPTLLDDASLPPVPSP